jgi:shikimate 5-dehydrogenase
MLVYQASEQIQLWTGQEPPIETLSSAFDAASAGRKLPEA